MNTFCFKVLYFHAETKKTVEKDYLSLVEELKVEHEQEDVRIREVNRKLAKIANEVIFIFDNVENYQFIEIYIRHLPPSIFVLTTARNIKTISDNRVLPIQLKPFSKEEAISYVDKVLNEDNILSVNKITEEEIENLIGTFGDGDEVIPFNLNKAVSILSNPSSNTVKEHLVIIKNNPKLWLHTKFYDDFMKNETIAKILELIYLFDDPDSIDMKLLKSMVCQNTTINSSEDSSFDRALAELEKNLLIKPNENGRKKK